jgi:hypothetical protein
VAEVIFEKGPQTEFDDPPTVARNYPQQLSYDAGTKRLEWYYSLKGDFDQDGRVFMDDLILFDIHNEKPGPFDMALVESLIDSNMDGYIATDDVTAFGMHLNQTLDGFSIYATPDPGQVPADPEAPPALTPIGFVPFDDASGDPLVDRLQFSAPLDVAAGSHVWIRPVLDDAVGSVSDVVTIE